MSSSAFPTFSSPTTATGLSTSARSRTWWAALLLLCVIQLPLLISMPLTSDTVLYDMQARTIQEGGVLYRDIFETNLPGVVWLHLVVRGVLGDSSEAMRLFDAGVLSGVLCLLGLCCHRITASTPRSLCLVMLQTVFYCSLSTWCHCQRDLWMLLPALVAVLIRWQRESRSVATSSGVSRALTSPVLEGAIWAMAFWLKPFVAIPALACWSSTAIERREWRLAARDAAGLLCGGLLIGLAGIAWLVSSETWPHFWATFADWNPRYLEAGRTRKTWDRFLGMAIRMRPWVLLHLVAIPVALSQITGSLRRSRSIDSTSRLRCLLSVFYLAWLAQTFLFQHFFDYIHVPEVLLALTVLFAQPLQMRTRAIERMAWGAFVCLVVLLSPAFAPERLASWSDCLRNGSTAENRDRLTDVNYPHFGEMEQVIAFLRTQNVQDGELTCYNVHLIHIYDELKLKPSTRYVGFSSLVDLFPRQVEHFQDELNRSRQRLVVSDMIEGGLTPSEALATNPETPQAPPPGYAPPADSYPWSLPVVFRAGRYLVHRVDGPVGPPLARIKTR